MFVSDPDYIIFTLPVTQQIKLQIQINNAMEKV